MNIEEQVASLVTAVANLTTQVETVATSVAAVVNAQAAAPVVDVVALEAAVGKAVDAGLAGVAEQIAALSTAVSGVPAQLQEILADITVQAPAAAGTSG